VTDDTERRLSLPPQGTISSLPSRRGAFSLPGGSFFR